MVLAPASRADVGRPIIQTLLPSTFGGGRCWSMAQDSAGMLYFGCDTLVTFDGERWAKYPVPGSYTLRGIAVTPDRVWVGAVNELGYFERRAGGLSPYHSLLSYLPADRRNIGDVWEVLAQGPEVVFTGSEAVYVWTGRELVVRPKPGARRLVGFSAGGKILVGHRPTGIWELAHEELRPFLTAAQLGGATGVWVGHDGQRWVVADSRGLFHFDGRTLAPFASPDAAAFLAANAVISGCFDRGGELVLGTLSGGVAIFRADGSLRRTLGTADGLPSQLVATVLIGRDGALWTAAPAGAARLALDEGVSFFDERLGLGSKDVNTLGQSGRELLAATDDGVYGMELEPGRGAFHPLPGLAGPYAGISSLPGGPTLLGTFRSVTALEGERPRPFLPLTSTTNVIRLSGAHPGTFFLSNDAEVLQAEAGGGVARIVGRVRLPDLPASIAEDATGHLWVGTETRGVFIFAEPLPPEGRPSPAPVRAAETGMALVARVGPQVAVFRASGIELYARPEGAPQPVAAAPATTPLAVSNTDATGHVWAVYDSPFMDEPRAPTLGRLAVPRQGAPRWAAFAAEGLGRLGRIYSLYVDDRGILWVGGIGGILRIDPATLTAVAPPGAPLLQASVAPGARLAAHQNQVQFDFAAPEYGRRESIRYQTLFTGDAAWSPPRNDPRLSVAGLRDGHYTFQVRTVTDTGDPGPVASLTFTVLPPWYRTLPALAAFAAAAAAVIYGAFRWRLAYLHRQNLRLEELVRKKTEQLERANEAKSEFLANMSHEIRNPISGILGLSLALEDTPLTARQQQLAESINSCASLLATLVDDVLDFSKIEAGRVDLRPAPFTLSVLLEQAASMVAAEARATGSPVRINLDPKLPAQLVGDVARLQQILLNYLTNALKFGPGRPIELGAAGGLHDRVRLFVRDHGPGMTPAESATLFTKFSRLESARLKNIRGTGLGLAVCRLIADRMGGRVGVDSWPGEGSCFWAEIPLAAAPAAPAADRPAGGPLRALVVEDIDYNVMAMQAILRRLGISSDAVRDGPAALERLLASFYDVAFLDWNLPGMNGNEVASRFRAAEPPGRRTFLIATTAHSSALTREACLQAGMDAFIAKPVTPAKIAEALQELGAALGAARKVETGPEAEPAAPPEIDLTMLRFLAAESPEGLAAQVQRFLTAFDADAGAARAAVAAGDAEEIRRTAHRLLSHCSLVKYAPLSLLASDLQRIAAFAPPADLRRLLEQFDQEYARLRCKLEWSLASTAPA